MSFTQHFSYRNVTFLEWVFMANHETYNKHACWIYICVTRESRVHRSNCSSFYVHCGTWIVTWRLWLGGCCGPPQLLTPPQHTKKCTKIPNGLCTICAPPKVSFVFNVLIRSTFVYDCITVQCIKWLGTAVSLVITEVVGNRHILGMQACCLWNTIFHYMPIFRSQDPIALFPNDTTITVAE